MNETTPRVTEPLVERLATTRRFALLALALLPLAACGRRGSPEAPPNADPAFPRIYPTR
jgi:hypothetical protein